jgi:hypothetical protein
MVEHLGKEMNTFFRVVTDSWAQIYFLVITIFPYRYLYHSLSHSTLSKLYLYVNRLSQSRSRLVGKLDALLDRRLEFGHGGCQKLLLKVVEGGDGMNFFDSSDLFVRRGKIFPSLSRMSKLCKTIRPTRPRSKSSQCHAQPLPRT